MALDPHSERPELAAPEDYLADHPHEKPEDWGWHAEWGSKALNTAGIITGLILVLMTTATHYNHSGTVWLLLFAVGCFGGVAWNIQRSRNSWRR